MPPETQNGESLKDLLKRIDTELEIPVQTEDAAAAPEDTGSAPAEAPGGKTGWRGAGGQNIRFMLDETCMAVPLSRAIEIGRRPRVTPLPNLPGWVLGVSNIRGGIISMVDLKAFFGIAAPAIRRESRFVVVRSEDGHGRELRTGLVVDRIIDIFTPSRHEAAIRSYLLPREDGATEKWSAFVSSVIPVNEEVINILDVDKLLMSPKMNAFTGG